MKKLMIGITMLLLTGLTNCSINVSHNEVDTWINESENILVAVEKHIIKDGTKNGMDIVQFVDLDTGVIYVYIEKFSSGYGLDIEPMLNADGTPKIYENLEDLRKEYNYEEN